MNKITLSIIILMVVVLFGWVAFSFIDSDDLGKQLDKQTAVEGDVIIKTNTGDITLDLYEEKMPITVGNFLKLAKEGFYDGTKFHRVIGGFMIQGGDPLTKDDTKKDSWGTGGPDYTIDDEFVDGLSNVRGTIAMANTGQPNSGGSQFFINLADNSSLDSDKQPLSSKHPVFGKVIEGMDVVDKIAQTETDSRDRPIQDVIIEEVVVFE